MQNIKYLFFDFDGVMTDNTVFVDQNGNESVQVNRADGLGVSEIRKMGIKQVIISTERNPVVAARAKKLGIPCIHGVHDKKKVLLEFCAKENADLKNVAYVGNDINDKKAMEIVGITFCPADAHESIKAISSHILIRKGGHGVIRELLDLFLKQKEG